MADITRDRRRTIAVDPGRLRQAWRGRARRRARHHARHPDLSQIQAILHAIGKLPHQRALLVSSNVGFGAGRMAQLLDPSSAKVFRDEDAALAWLAEKEPAEVPRQFDRSQSGRML